MKITKRQLRKTIREALLREMAISAEDAEQYLRDNAATYRDDPDMSGSSMRMLLMDDFMDDLGHQHSIDDFQDLIDELSLDTPAPAGLSQEVEELSPPRKRRKEPHYASTAGRQRQGGRGGFGSEPKW
jgi:hypothetical protein